MNNFGLPQRTIKELLEYFISKPEIEKVCIYGSRAKGSYQRASDIDLAVEGGDIDKFAVAMEEETSTLLKFDVLK